MNCYALLWVDPFIKRWYPSLSLRTFFALKFTLFDINVTTTTYCWLVFVTYIYHYYYYYYFWPCCVACGVFVPWPGIKPVSPALEAQSLNHWATREVPVYHYIWSEFTMDNLELIHFFLTMVTICLLTSVLRPFTFNAFIDMFGFKFTILLFILCLFPLFLFVCLLACFPLCPFLDFFGLFQYFLVFCVNLSIVTF